MSTPLTDEQLDRQLRAFLDRQARQLDGAPSADMVSAAIAARHARRSGLRATGRLIWAVVILGLLFAMTMAVVLVGGHGPHVPPPATTSPSTVTTLAPTLSPQQLLSAQACTVPLALTPGGDKPASPGAGVSGPTDGRVAFVPPSTFPGVPPQIWLAGGGARGAQVIANFTGVDLYNWVLQVVGSSGDGSVLLIATSHFGGSDCGDLFLVRADGTTVTKLTDNAASETALAAVLGPDGRSVAYVERGRIPSSGAVWGELRMIDAAGTTRVLDPAPCGNGLAPDATGELMWSPDGSRLALTCTTSVAVYLAAGGTPRVLDLPAGTLAAGITWSADGRRILVAALPQGAQAGPVTVASLDAGTGASTVVSRSSLSLDWVIQVNLFSPDRRWVLVSGDTSGSGLYLINVASGATRPVVGSYGSGTGPVPPGSFQWLPDSSGFVAIDDAGDLQEIGLDGATAKTIGVFPWPGSAYWIGP